MSYSRVQHNYDSTFYYTKYQPTTYNYTLSLHDALPISPMFISMPCAEVRSKRRSCRLRVEPLEDRLQPGSVLRSEEHTSELQSPYDLVCRLLLEKKKII